MKFEAARAAIYSRLDTAWSSTHAGVAVRYENRLKVDLANEQAAFITCEIVFNDGEQMQIGTPKGTRYRGGIWLSVYQREEAGVAPGLTWLEELADLFKMTTFGGGVNTRAAIPMPGYPHPDHKGWYVTSLRVPFWFDDQT